MAQNNLGNALAGQAGRTEGAEGTVLLDEAVAAHRAALEVHARSAHPVDWAITQENLGLVFEAVGDRDDDPAHRYAQALDCLDAPQAAVVVLAELAGLRGPLGGPSRAPARDPIDRILQAAGDGPVVFRSGEEDAIDGRNALL
jgi:hypothetical protein